MPDPPAAYSSTYSTVKCSRETYSELDTELDSELNPKHDSELDSDVISELDPKPLASGVLPGFKDDHSSLRDVVPKHPSITEDTRQSDKKILAESMPRQELSSKFDNGTSKDLDERPVKRTKPVKIGKKQTPKHLPRLVRLPGYKDQAKTVENADGVAVQRPPSESSTRTKEEASRSKQPPKPLPRLVSLPGYKDQAKTVENADGVVVQRPPSESSSRTTTEASRPKQPPKPLPRLVSLPGYKDQAKTVENADGVAVQTQYSTSTSTQSSSQKKQEGRRASRTRQSE